MPLALEKMRGFGLMRTEVDRVLDGPDGRAPDYHCVGHLYFKHAEGFYTAMAAAADEIRADVPAYTDVRGTVVVAEMFGGAGELLDPADA